MVNDTNTMDAITDDYWIRRIIHVNSGSSSYVELPMDQTGALFGNNNEGKTSGLSALKLFILPETNFNDAQSKFGFQSGGEFYSGIDSYNHYFPSSSSFIICEAENPKSTFCIVLHQSKEQLGYGRIAVPCAYGEISWIFWDKGSDKNDGLGEHAGNLNPADVLKALKPYKAIQLRTKQDIRDATYTRYSPVDGLSNYCMIPLLQKSDQGSVNTLRALLSLAFDIKGGGKNKLPEAIATIIDAENSSRDNSLSIDVGVITAEYNDLRKEGEYLRAVKASTDTWNTLNQSYKNHRDVGIDLRKAASSLKASIGKNIQSVDLELSPINDQLRLIEDQLGELNPRISKKNASINEKKGALKEQKKYLEDSRGRLDRVAHIRGQNAPLGLKSDNELVAYLEGLVPKIKSDIAVIQDQEKGVADLAKLNNERADIQERIDKLKRELEYNNPGPLVDMESEHQDRLYSLNPSLAQIGTQPTDSEKKKISQFADLLGVDDGYLSFLGERLPNSIDVHRFDPQEVRKNNENTLSELNSNAKSISKDMEKINKLLIDCKSASYREEKLVEYNEELDQTKRGIKLLRRTDLQEEYEKFEQSVAQTTETIEQLSNDLQKLTNNKQTLTASRLLSEESKSRLVDSKGKLETLKQQLTNEYIKAFGLDSSIIEDSMAQSLSSIQIENDFKDFCEEAQKYPEYQKIVQRNLRRLMESGIVDAEPEDIESPTLDGDRFQKIYQDLRAVFENINESEIKHNQNIESHNHETSTRITMIKDLSMVIGQFQKQLNRELSGCSVSNLDSVAINIEVDIRFRELQKELENMSFEGAVLKNGSFYQRLEDFCDQFFNDTRTSVKRIKLSKVITNVQYRYKFIDSVTRTAQSNGTNAMVNSVLLALLLKRLVSQNTRLHFPIIFDEVGSLDSKNLPSIKDVAESNDFILFVVNPVNNGLISSVIDNWYDLSLFRSTEETIGSCNVIHYGMTEGISPITDGNSPVELDIA